MNKPRILIVDDEATFAKMLRFNLEVTGDYEVDCEHDSANVVPHALQFRPDLVLLDIVMPGLDGGSVKHQIESHPKLRNIPIVFVTALVSREDAGDGLFIESGGNCMLPKPIELPHLLQAIECKLKSKATAPALEATEPIPPVHPEGFPAGKPSSSER